MSMTYDLTFLNTAINKMREIPKKVGKDVVNKSALQITIGSGSAKGLVQLTKKATEARIRKDLGKMVSYKGRKRGSRSVRLIILLATRALVKRKEKPTRMAVYSEGLRIIKARIQSRAYIAAGWLAAAKDMAAKVPGHGLNRLEPRNIPTRDDASAAESFAIAATQGRLVAGIFNTSRGAGIICPPSVIQQAIDGETDNLNQYLDRVFSRAIGRAVKGFDPEDGQALRAA
jgi:hypothetical protein